MASSKTMQENTEGEICRVCRSEGTAEQPLFYPCLCSGSIKYIHQECLTEWLAHSQKQFCELCNHPFSFSPNVVYAENMPKQLPLGVFIAGLFKRSLKRLSNLIRYLMVGIVWLIICPYITHKIYLFYFPETELAGDSWSIIAPSNITAKDERNIVSPVYVTSGFLFWKTFLWECFIGSFISSAILLGFLSLMILRDFVVTNAVLNEVQVPMEAIIEEQNDMETPRRDIDDLEFVDGNSPSASASNRMVNVPAYSTTNYSDIDSQDFVSNLRLEAQGEGADDDDGDISEAESWQIEAPAIIKDVPAGATSDENENSQNTVQSNFNDLLNDNFENQNEIGEANEAEQGNVVNDLENFFNIFDNDNNEDNNAAANRPERQEELTIYELLGIRGPIYYLAQNLVVILLTNTMAIGFFMFIPYITGYYLASLPYQDTLKALYTITIQPWVDVLQLNNLNFDFNILFQSLLPLLQNDAASSDEISLSKKLFFAFIGYVVWSLSVFTLTRFLNMKRNSPILKLLNFISLFLKVVTLIGFELILFPLLCGFLIDCSTLKLFNSVLADSISLTIKYPFLSFFLHWVVGSTFMFLFAIFISLCRDVVRPGLLYFIRNPNDPNYQPMKELVERTIGYQLKRIFISGVIYSFIIFMVFGVSLSIFHAIFPSLFPFQFKLNDYSLILDVLLTNTLIPLIFSKFPLKDNVRNSIAWVFARLSKFMCISSYFYGGRYMMEESSCKGKFVFVPSFDHAYSADERIPATGKVVTPLDMQKYGLTEPEDERVLLGTQRMENVYALKPDVKPLLLSDFHRLDNRYTLVYRPDSLRTRVLVFLTLVWVCVVVALFSLIFLPILLGRWLQTNIFGLVLNDLYTFQIGFDVMLITACSIYYSAKYAQRIKENGITVDQFMYHLGLFLFKCLKISYCVTFLICVFPFLVGFYVDIIFVLPFRGTDETMIFLFLQEWLLGLLISRIIYSMLFYLSDSNTIKQGLTKQLQNDGIWEIDLQNLNRKIILPIVLFFVFSIAAPYVLIRVISHLTNNTEDAFNNDQMKLVFLLFSLVYPLYFFLNRIFQTFEHLMNVIRDDSYLIGKRLHNLERT